MRKAGGDHLGDVLEGGGAVKAFLFCAAVYLVVGFCVMTALACAAAAIESRGWKETKRERFRRSIADIEKDNGPFFVFSMIVWPIVLGSLFLYGLYKLTLWSSMRVVMYVADQWDRRLRQ